MSEFECERFESADFERSTGFQEWKRRQLRSAVRPNDGIRHQPRSAGGGAGSRLATLRRDLEAIEIKVKPAAPLVASGLTRIVSLRPDARGHFCAQVSFNGRNVPMMIDTGATFCSLTEEDAEQVGIRLRADDFTRELSTQNGRIKVAPVLISSMRVGPIAMNDVHAVVARRNPGSESLLGMSFLNRLCHISMENGCLNLRG